MGMGEIRLTLDAVHPFLPLCGTVHLDHPQLLRESEVVRGHEFLPHVHLLDCRDQLHHGDDSCTSRLYSLRGRVHHGTCGGRRWDKHTSESLTSIITYTQLVN